MTDIICTAISAVSAVLVAIFANRQSKEIKDTEARAKLRKQESLLSLRMMSASLDLCLVEAEAITSGHLNGNVEAAKEKAKKAAEEYDDFMRKVVSEEVRL